MSEFQDKLPPNWIASSLGEICSQPQYGYTTKGSDIGTLRLLRTTDITSGKIFWEDVPFCLENPTDEAKYLLEDGDIVISRAGSVGVSYLLRNPERSVFASYLIRFKPYINTQYFKYFLDSPYYWQEIADNKLGIAVPNVNASKLKEIAIPLPPKNEQHRIVAKIEELFSELDKGIESLKTARAQLKVYRQALLKHAFEGKLTAQWRAENPDKLETADALLKRIQQERAQRYQQQLADWEAAGKQGSKPKAPKPLPPLTAEDLAELPELPKGWGWMKYGDLCSIVRNGISAKPEGESGTPIFRISAVRPLFFDMADTRFIDNATGEFDAYCLERGDLVFTRYNGSRRYVGVCAEYRSDEKRLFPDKLVQTRVFSKYMSTSYLEKALNSGASRKFVESKIRTTAGQSGVSGDDIKNIPVPFCSTNEQIQIFEELESKLSEVDQLEQTLTTSLQQAEALRQSILKKAFAGLLVPQDPHDEPASKLLARIQAERAAVAAKPRKKSVGDKLSPTEISPLLSVPSPKAEPIKLRLAKEKA